jgi:hypothetical protein
MYMICTFYTSAVTVYLRPSIITGTHTVGAGLAQSAMRLAMGWMTEEWEFESR